LIVWLKGKSGDWLRLITLRGRSRLTTVRNLASPSSASPGQSSTTASRRVSR
jgi:hypothetical protein